MSYSSVSSSLDVWFGTNRVSPGDFVSSSIVNRSMLNLSWNSQPGALYTVIVYDLDYPAPSPHNNDSPYVYVLTINVPDNDFSRGLVLLSYQYPNISSDHQPHNFQIDVYQQSKKMRPELHLHRNNFKVGQFVSRHGLQLVAQSKFTVGLRNPRSPSPPLVNRVKGSYFKPGTTLSREEQSYCRCVLHVAAKQPGECNMEKAWFEKKDGEVCYNPYSVCASSIGTTSRQCGRNYAFENIPDRELRAYANLSGINVPNPYRRDVMLQNISDWKSSKGY